jgi:hypothetical protein
VLAVLTGVVVLALSGGVGWLVYFKRVADAARVAANAPSGGAPAAVAQAASAADPPSASASVAPPAASSGADAVGSDSPSGPHKAGTIAPAAGKEDKRIAVRQQPPQEDNPNARFIGDEANKHAEQEQVLRLADAGATPGAPAAKTDPDFEAKKRAHTVFCSHNQFLLSQPNVSDATLRQVETSSCLPGNTADGSRCERENCRLACTMLKDSTCIQRVAFADQSFPAKY